MSPTPRRPPSSSRTPASRTSSPPTPTACRPSSSARTARTSASAAGCGTRRGPAEPLAVRAEQEHTRSMRTLTRRLQPHARTSWLTFAAVSVVAVVVALATLLLNDGGRVAVVMTAFTWLVVVVALAAVLDAILAPGNPDVRRASGQSAGWTGLGAAGWSGGHGGSGGDGGSCG